MPKNKNDLLEKLKMLSDSRILGLLTFGVVAMLVTWSGVKAVQINYELEKKISIARQKNEIDKLDNQNLKLKNTYYGTNQFLELSARRQFGKAAKDEKLYIVPEKVALAGTKEMPKAQVEVQKDEDANKPKYRQNLESWSEFLFR